MAGDLGGPFRVVHSERIRAQLATWAKIAVERGFAADTLAALRAKGHRVIEALGQTSANSIAVTDDGLLGAPDPRTRGAAASGH